MDGHENASIIDIKMGTSTVTCNVKESPKRLQKRHMKDKATTSFKLGMKIIGYVIKSSEKDIEEKFYKFPYIQELEISEVLRKIFSWPSHDQNEDMLDDQIQEKAKQDLNIEAVETILKELLRLQDFLVNRSQRDIKGASILILCDHFSRKYCVKMIDLSTISIYEDSS